MTLTFLRSFDRWAGPFLLYLLALPVRLYTRWWPTSTGLVSRLVFLKLKGGGSLIIAMPALLGLRRQNPHAAFILVCTREARLYAKLTGLFDRYVVIDDATPLRLLCSGLRALRACFRATSCIDLEPNSQLAAVFTLATCATRRTGFVRADRPSRAQAYTDPIAFDPGGPLYLYHDRLAAASGSTIESREACADLLRARLPHASAAQPAPIGLSPFTSDFARERMMPPEVWVRLLRDAYAQAQPAFVIFGAARDEAAAGRFAAALQDGLPGCTVTVRCGGAFDASVALLAGCAAFWSVDTGLLHIARLLQIPCHSFWGPTRPDQRLRPFDGLIEKQRFHAFQCAPCLQTHDSPPCGGDNLCMTTLDQAAPDLRPPWMQETRP